LTIQVCSLSVFAQLVFESTAYRTPGADYSLFNTNFLFDGQSISKEKDTVKEKNRAEGKGMEGVFSSIQAGIKRLSFGLWLL